MDYFALASLSLRLTSCYPGTLEAAVNHSGQTLTVISMATELQDTAYQIENNQTVRIKVPFKLRVKCGGETWDYDLPPMRLPENFQKSSRQFAP